MTWTVDAEFGENIIFAASPRLFSLFRDETHPIRSEFPEANLMQVHARVNIFRRLINRIAIFAIITS